MGSRNHCCQRMTDALVNTCKEHPDPFDCPDSFISSRGHVSTESLCTTVDHLLALLIFVLGAGPNLAYQLELLRPAINRSSHSSAPASSENSPSA